MAFLGTQQKCKVCEKTVYLMDQLMADGVTYHKSCFKCNHCKGTLKLSNYSSMEGVLYCKPHFEQLFREAGNFNKNFQSPAKSSQNLTPALTRSPSKAAGMFSGTQEKCAICLKTAYPLEKVTVEGLAYHKSCFRCSHGGCPHFSFKLCCSGRHSVLQAPFLSAFQGERKLQPSRQVRLNEAHINLCS